MMDKLKVETAVISKQGKESENYKKFKEIVKKKKIKVIVVGQGDTIKIEKNLYFDILWPNNSSFISENILNNNSLVCKLQYKNFSMLFTGDIEKIAEQEILKQYETNKENSEQIANKNILKSTVLKVAHHGSKSSSIQDFLSLVQPQIALIGVGQDNKFGHPNEDVLQRLEIMRN